MNNKKKIGILVVSIIAIIIAFTFGISKATTLSDITDMEGKKKNAIGDVINLGYGSIYHKMNTYCIQYGKTLHSSPLEFVVDKYIEIDGKTATIYNSATSSGKEVKSNYNAILAYIFNQKQGYGEYKNNTDGQNALWSYVNKWANTLLGTNNSYSYNENNGVSIANNSIAKKAQEYASNIGKITTASNEEKLDITDNTKNKELKKLNVGNDYYRVGPFNWTFEGDIESIIVKADGKKVTDVKFVKLKGTVANYIDIKDIESGDKFYIDIKDAKDITSVNVNIKTSKKITVETVKVWLLKSANTYQNLVHVLPTEKSVKAKGEENFQYSVKQDSVKIGLQKVDDRGEETSLQNVGFVFKAQILSYDFDHSEDHYTWVPGYTDKDNVYHSGYNQYEWTQNFYEWRTHTMYIDNNNMWNDISESEAKIFYTDSDGKINVSGINFKQNFVSNRWKGDTGTYISTKYANGSQATAIEKVNPYYGYEPEIGKQYTVNSINETKLLYNHQKYVKLSGYVWLDQNQEKTTIRNNLYDQGVEKGVNGITVYLKNSAGQIIKQTTTSELGLYNEIEGGEYRFTEVDLDELPGYYIEYEYCGITYQSVASNLNKTTGSKAIDTNSRNILDNKFTSVNGNGTQNLNISGVNVNYNKNSNEYNSTIASHTGCNVSARTDEAGYNLYDDFEPTMEEIRNINLGLFEKEQTDYALTKDLYNVRVEVNGKSHVYRYGTTRYSKDGEVNKDSSWNVGVKFQNNRGTYNRAIYTSDAEYETPNHKDRELKVYTTYKIALKNESTYLGKINSILDYCDTRMNLIAAGTTINDQDQIGGNINYSDKQQYNDKYSKYIVYPDTTIEAGETKFIYIQFEMNREAVLSLINNGEVLNNVAEINSYTTFKDNNVNTPVAVIDNDSVPGNMIPGQIETYEDDTDTANSLKLELKDARAITGTVFVDSTGKDSNTVYKNEERKGNGLFDDGETTLAGVKVKLSEIGKEDSSYDGERIEKETTTDNNGNFEFVGFVPGDYVITYTWGNKEYKVQYYKGTIYNEGRTTVTSGNKYWYRGNTEGNNDDIINKDTRATDAMDNATIRKTIEEEMNKITKNTLQSEIDKAYENGSETIKTTQMNSTTPEMSISVEYPTTITDGTVDQVKFAITNVDFGIVERAKQQLNLTKRISGYKITLANGQVLINATIDENGKVTGTVPNTAYMGPTDKSIGLIKTEMDNELIEGATLEVKYTIKVTNIGELDYTSDKYYYFGNATGAEKVKISPTQILDYVDGRLSVVDTNWKDTAENYSTDYNISQKDNTEYLNNVKTFVTDKLSKTYLAPDESVTVDLQTSKLLTSTDDNEFNNKAEITETKKNAGFNTGTPVKLSFENKTFNVADSEKVTIIPSTGENKNYVIPVITGIIAITILGVGIFSIKKFVIDRNK